MKTRLALTILSAACIGIAGCMGVDRDDHAENGAANAERHKFVASTSQALLKAAEIMVPDQDETVGSGADADAIRALGCPKLADFVEDMQDHQGTDEEPLPESAQEFLGCFGISGTGTLDDVDKIFDKLKDAEALLDCICGGSALSKLIGGRISLFSVQATAAAQAYSAAASSAGGSSYNGASGSAGGSGYSASGSSAADAYTSP